MYIYIYINLVQVASKVQIKQKLPFKLANKLSNSNTNTTTTESTMSPNNITSPTQSAAYAIQQLLPLKLRESAKNPMNTVQSSPSEVLAPSNQSPSHSRTGSSPAMMQNPQVRFSCYIIVYNFLWSYNCILYNTHFLFILNHKKKITIYSVVLENNYIKYSIIIPNHKIKINIYSIHIV